MFVARVEPWAYKTRRQRQRQGEKLKADAKKIAMIAAVSVATIALINRTGFKSYMNY